MARPRYGWSTSATLNIVPRPAIGECVGPNPTDRGKPGTKRHVLVEAGGVPLALSLSPANTHDSRLFEPLIDAVPPIWQCADPEAMVEKIRRGYHALASMTRRAD
jgi:hypothetical protein